MNSASRTYRTLAGTTRGRRAAWLAGLAVPAAAGLLGTTVALHWLPYPLGTACGLTLLALLLTTIVTDSCWKRIPNWATYPALTWLLAFNVFGSLSAGSGFESSRALAETGSWPLVGPPSLGAIGISASLFGAVSCFAVMVVLSGFLRGSGGDVKLMTAIGACLGVRYGLLAMLLGYVLAGCWSLILCTWYYGLWNIVRGVFAWIGHLLMPMMVARPVVHDDRLLKSGVPLGAHFALGTVLALIPVVPGIHY